jgi:large subunit ribosomal protein L9
MEVILLEKVDNLGKLGDRVKVRRGYARNYLIPKGKATEATGVNLQAFEARRAELEQAEATALDSAHAKVSEMHGVTLAIPVKVGSEGRLFGSVGSADIVAAAARAGIELQRSQIRLPDTIRQVGIYEIGVHLHAEVDGVLKVEVLAEE